MTARLDDYSQFRGWHGDFTSDDVTIVVPNVQQDMTVTYDTVPDIDGCSTDVAAGYSGGFQATDFKRVNVDVDTVTGHMVLNTGNQAIDPNNIMIPFTQDVYVTFLYEGAGFQNSDFGYKFASEGKAGTKHQVYANINDNDNDGVLDGVGDRNLDGTIDRQDNKVFLGTIEGGTELVFYLDSTDNGCGGVGVVIFSTPSVSGTIMTPTHAVQARQPASADWSSFTKMPWKATPPATVMSRRAAPAFMRRVG